MTEKFRMYCFPSQIPPNSNIEECSDSERQYSWNFNDFLTLVTPRYRLPRPAWHVTWPTSLPWRRHGWATNDVHEFHEMRTCKRSPHDLGAFMYQNQEKAPNFSRQIVPLILTAPGTPCCCQPWLLTTADVEKPRRATVCISFVSAMLFRDLPREICYI